ncbi:Cation transport regulator-like protein 2, partial [Trichinella zimbabwensis]
LFCGVVCRLLLELSYRFACREMDAEDDDFDDRFCPVLYEGLSPEQMKVKPAVSKIGFRIFVYGDLIWRHNFPFHSTVKGYIKGQERLFIQGSMDCYGTKEQPGRVATLYPEDEGIVWGITYLVNEEDVDETKFRMDVEPKPGHCLMKAMFYPADKSEPYEVFTPLSVPSENPCYYGKESFEETVEAILRSSGMCGSNVDYIFRLAQHLREIGSEAMDPKLAQLEESVVKLCLERGIHMKSIKNFGYD